MCHLNLDNPLIGNIEILGPKVVDKSTLPRRMTCWSRWPIHKGVPSLPALSEEASSSGVKNSLKQDVAINLSHTTDRERKEETWILVYLKFAGATTRLAVGRAPEITARQHTSTQLCAGTGQVSSFLSPSVLMAREETWILAYLKIAGATTSMLSRLVSNATLLKTNNSIARINNSQGWLWGEAPEITARQHTSTHLCAGSKLRQSFLPNLSPRSSTLSSTSDRHLLHVLGTVQ
ncbi:hypothetical protein J6590_090627 [Homalodisca vitripennis]|nr:hypothetical protein J6590_090627 [Homalodisca vitripennis]